MDRKKNAAPTPPAQERQDADKTTNASEREALIREYERRLARLKSGASPEDVILREVEKLLKTPKEMTEVDCRNLQTLVCTAGRIQAIRNGNFRSNYPGVSGGNRMNTVKENERQAAEYFKRLASRKERRWRRVRNALLIWSLAASAISIVLLLIRLAQ